MPTIIFDTRKKRKSALFEVITAFPDENYDILGHETVLIGNLLTTVVVELLSLYVYPLNGGKKLFRTTINAETIIQI